MMDFSGQIASLIVKKKRITKSMYLCVWFFGKRDGHDFEQVNWDLGPLGMMSMSMSMSMCEKRWNDLMNHIYVQYLDMYRIMK